MKTEAGGKAPYKFNWLNEHLRTADERRIYAQELAVLIASQTVVDAMEAAHLSRAELAGRIGKTKGYVSQVLGGRNMTMRTFGDLLWACDRQIAEVLAVPLGESTVSHDFMDCWLESTVDVGEEDSLATSHKALELSLEDQVPIGVVA